MNQPQTSEKVLNDGGDWYPFGVPASRLKAAVILLLGSLLRCLRPQRMAELQAARFDDFADLSRQDRWMLAALGAYARRNHQLELLQPVHKKFWEAGEGASLHQHYADRFETDFLKHHAEIAVWLREEAASAGATRLVEFGCGRGETLEYCVNEAGFQQGTGVDLSAQLLDIARASIQNPALDFQHSDAIEWLKAHGQPGTVFLTNGGVLEYFTPAQLQEMFSHIQTHLGPSLVALVEPLGLDHDQKASPKSQIYGSEMSFSHPYDVLLEAAGLKVVRKKDYRVGDRERWMMVVATTTSAQT